MIDEAFTMAVELVKEANGIPRECMFLTTALALNFDGCVASARVGCTVAVVVETVGLTESKSGGAHVLTLSATLLSVGNSMAIVSQLLDGSSAMDSDGMEAAVCCRAECTMVAQKQKHKNQVGNSRASPGGMLVGPRL
jgi:hypothetical protein